MCTKSVVQSHSWSVACQIDCFLLDMETDNMHPTYIFLMAKQSMKPTKLLSFIETSGIERPKAEIVLKNLHLRNYIVCCALCVRKSK